MNTNPRLPAEEAARLQMELRRLQAVAALFCKRMATATPSELIILLKRRQQVMDRVEELFIPLRSDIAAAVENGGLDGDARAAVSALQGTVTAIVDLDRRAEAQLRERMGGIAVDMRKLRQGRRLSSQW